MAHDGQDGIDAAAIILDDLPALTQAALEPAGAVLDAARDAVRVHVTADGRVSGALVERHQTAAHGLAWLATYVEALRQMHNWANRLIENGDFGEIEQIILQIAFGEYLAQIRGGIQMNQGEIIRLQDLGVASGEIAA